MTQPDYREKARELWQEILRDRYLPSFPNVDKGKLIVQALEDAHLAGRREGIEEAAKVADDAAHYRREHKRKGPAKGSLYSCDVDREIDALAIAGNIRALLRGGKEK